MGQATLRDVAELAGVSMSTVSRVLNGTAQVAPEKKQRVEEALAQLDYVTNLSAKTLRSGQSGTWALLVDDLCSAFFSDLADSLTRCALAHGRTLLIVTTQKDYQRERSIVAAMRARQVDGLFVVAASGDNHGQRALRGLDLPTVFVERFPTGVSADVVTFDYYAAGREQIDRLWQAGHRRIAFLGGNTLEDPGVRRLSAYRDGLRDHGVEPDERLIAAHQSGDTAEQAFADMLDLADPPTAVVATVAPLLFAVLRLARARGVSFDVCSYESLDVPELTPVQLTVIGGDLQALAQRATELMLNRLDHPAAPHTTALLGTVSSVHLPKREP